MAKYNILQDKSFRFALKTIKFCEILENNHKFVFSTQLLKSGTSIGANIEESLGAISTKEFYAKLFISYKESRETLYWIKLIKLSKIINLEDNKLNELEEDCVEIIKILTVILKKRK